MPTHTTHTTDISIPLCQLATSFAHSQKRLLNANKRDPTLLRLPFLGFTHYCGQSRARRFKLKRRTAKRKLRTKLRDLKNWFHLNLTTPLSDVWATLNAKLRGHYQYYGINDNWPSLMAYREAAIRLAFRWLNRRSQSRSKTWSEFYQYADRFRLASPKQLTDLIAMARPR